MQNKSAKDIAFEKERAKYRQEIRSLQSQLQTQEKEFAKELTNLRQIITEKDAELESKDEWIGRLLEYTEISKEELQELIESEKQRGKAELKIAALFDGFNRFAGDYFR